MNSLKLKETMNQIHISQTMQEEIIMNVKNQTANRQRRYKVLKKAAITAAAFVLCFGAAMPIQAGIRNYVKNRLEHIPKQELEAMNQMLQAQDSLLADSFSREYSKEERTRMKQLEEDYQNGTFPEQPIMQTDSSKQIPEDVLSYDTDTGTFYLPDRTLTDEELLQIIDFKYTSDYALAQSSAAQKAQKSQEKEEKRLTAAIQEKGGITEQEALKTAETYLETEFGQSAKNMEVHVLSYQSPDGLLTYHVSYHTQDDTFFYSYGIDLNAVDGSLIDTSYASLPQDPSALKLP
ncbi:MAG: hypothetical protein HFH41_00620 [Lachnospiraceae bacterium]|nr:hypothetical protein [Lachnospiraceae bacterium]